MTNNLIDVFPKQRNTPMYVKLVDLFFYCCLLASPFFVAFFDKKTGSGFLFGRIMMAVLFPCTLILFKQYYRNFHWVFILFLPFVIIGTVGDLCLIDYLPVSYILAAARQLLIPVFMGVISLNIVRRNPIALKILAVIIVINAISSAFCMWMGFGVNESEEVATEGYRYAVVGQNANETGQAMVYAIVFVFLLLTNAVRMSKIYRWIFLILSPLLLLCLLRVASRGSILLLAILIPITLSTVKSVSKKALYFVLCSIGAVALVFAVLSTDMLRSRLENAFYERDTGGRERIFYVTMEIWRKSSLFGDGCINYSVDVATLTGENTFNRSSHNMYTRLLASSGLFGFIPYMVAVCFVFKKAYRLRFLEYGNYYYLILIGMLLSGIICNVEIQKRFYILCALILGLDYHVSRNPWVLRYKEI